MAKGKPASAPYLGYTVYKVYHAQEGRFFAVLVSKDHRTTIAHAKYILETSLGRKLKDGYQAHHKDEDKLNDTIENLEEKSESVHRADHARRAVTKHVLLECPNCKNDFLVRYNRTHWAKKSGNATHCSRKCGWKARPERSPQAIKQIIFKRQTQI